MVIEQSEVTRRALFRVPRSRGAISGTLIVLLGAWSVVIPFVGPAFHFGYTPDRTWIWTQSRAVLELAPGLVAILGGSLLILSGRRIGKSIGGVLATIAGGWLIAGTSLAASLHLEAPGRPLGAGNGIRAVETLTLFTGLGGVIVLFAAHASGRLSVRSLGDIRSAEHTLEHANTQTRWKNEHLSHDPVPTVGESTVPAAADRTAQQVRPGTVTPSPTGG